MTQLNVNNTPRMDSDERADDGELQPSELGTKK